MSTLFLALRLFLLTLGSSPDLGNGLDVAGRLRHAALLQNPAPVHQPENWSLWFGFFTLKRAKDK